MEVRFFLPYYEPADLSFKADDKYYSDGEYEKAVADEERRTRRAVIDRMTGAAESVGGLIVTEYDPTRSMRHSNMTTAEDVVRYAVCDGVLYGSDGSSETPDGVFNHISRQDRCVYMLEFGEDVCDDEFMREIKMWTADHNKLSKYAEVAGDEWILQHEPKRDVYFRFKNSVGQNVSSALRGCRIMDIADRKSLIVLSERVAMVDNVVE